LTCSLEIHAGGASLCIAQSNIDWHFFVTPTIAIVSAAVALLALINARALARKKATIDLIEKTESTQHYRDINAAFSAVRRGEGFAELVDTPPSEALRRQINDYLNHYELIALGIRRGVLDGGFYRAWMGKSFVRDWNEAVPWIEQERWRRQEDGSWKYHPSVFEHYERIACK
jgi:hypothetical protein